MLPKTLLIPIVGLCLLVMAIALFLLRKNPATAESMNDATAENTPYAQPQVDTPVELETAESTVDDSKNSEALPQYGLARFYQSENMLRNDPDDWFEQAHILAQAGQPEMIYLQQVHSLLDAYSSIVKEGGHPTGLNIEITNALLGKNSKRIALLAQSHPRINNQGELVDSWGTPYQFHHESLRDASIRSAGPDLILYTDDDVVY